MTTKELAGAGYRDLGPLTFRMANNLWQKEVMIGEVTLYFVNIYQYGGIERDIFAAGVCLYRPSKQGLTLTFTIEPGQTVREVEELILRVYGSLSCVPGVHNND